MYCTYVLMNVKCKYSLLLLTLCIKFFPSKQTKWWQSEKISYFPWIYRTPGRSSLVFWRPSTGNWGSLSVKTKFLNESRLSCIRSLQVAFLSHVTSAKLRIPLSTVGTSRYFSAILGHARTLATLLLCWQHWQVSRRHVCQRYSLNARYSHVVMRDDREITFSRD